MKDIKLKIVRQSSSFCGPASLSSLLDFYGVKLSEKQLGKLCGTTVEAGTEPAGLVRTLRHLGFKPVAKELGTWAELTKIITDGTPIIVNWWSDYEKPADGHYSVAYKITNKSIYLMDPELGGYRRMSKDKFMCQWYDFYASGRKNSRWYLYIAK
jgi:ABC-type bacteriocin/lantibiotic exporter with double-glycine peptidase domain